MEGIENFIISIETFRDKQGAHVDKARANKNKITVIKLDIKEFEKNIKLLENIFTYYWEQLIGHQYLTLGEGEAFEDTKEIIKILKKIK